MDEKLDRTIVIKVGKKTHEEGSVPVPRLLQHEQTPKSPEEARKHLAALAALYRLMRGG